MAMSTKLLSKSHMPDGSLREVYECFADDTTGTFTLKPTTAGITPAPDGPNDFRRVMVQAFDTSTVGTVITAAINISTGVVTLGGMIADTALTGESGGSAGTYAFVGTGGVVGTAITGAAQFAADSMVIAVSGTDITVDKPLLAAVTAAVLNTHAIVEVTYNK